MQAAFIEACSRGDAGAAVKLLDDGADPNLADATGLTALHFACTFACTDDYSVTLLDNGTDASAADAHHQTPLHFARSNDRVDIATFLIDKGAALNAANVQGATALHLCCSSARVQTWTPVRKIDSRRSIFAAPRDSHLFQRYSSTRVQTSERL
jgi:ankyrin repeat protein